MLRFTVSASQVKLRRAMESALWREPRFRHDYFDTHMKRGTLKTDLEMTAGWRSDLKSADTPACVDAPDEKTPSAAEA